MPHPFNCSPSARNHRIDIMLKLGLCLLTMSAIAFANRVGRDHPQSGEHEPGRSAGLAFADCGDYEEARYRTRSYCYPRVQMKALLATETKPLGQLLRER